MQVKAKIFHVKSLYYFFMTFVRSSFSCDTGEQCLDLDLRGLTMRDFRCCSH